MNIGAFAKKRAEALAEIARKTDIDLSVGSDGIKARDPQIRSLQQLEKIANGLPEPREDDSMIFVEDVMPIIRGVKGVGVTLADKIEEALKEQ